MQADLTIRAAAPCELCEVARAEAACFPDPWSEASLLSHAGEEGGVVLVAVSGGRLCGFLTARLMPPECELYRIAVLPQARRSGIGRALLARFLEESGAQGCTVCFLEVRAGNLPAISLYKEQGFCEIGRRRGYYRDPREDAVLMRLGSPE